VVGEAGCAGHLSCGKCVIENMATRNPFVSDKELLDYSDGHLLYEIEMFHWLASILPGKKESNECSAFVESYALHLRNLIDFFYTEPTDDDVVAKYFYDDPSKWNPGPKSPALDIAKKRANKEVSHLTKARMNVTPTDKLWWTDNLFSDIQKVAQSFLAGASPKKLGPKVTAFITAHYNAPTATTLLPSEYSPRTNVTAHITTVSLGPPLKPRTSTPTLSPTSPKTYYRGKFQGWFLIVLGLLMTTAVLALLAAPKNEHLRELAVAIGRINDFGIGLVNTGLQILYACDKGNVAGAVGMLAAYLLQTVGTGVGLLKKRTFGLLLLLLLAVRAVAQSYLTSIALVSLVFTFGSLPYYYKRRREFRIP
jgi:hypothetical protein